MQSITINFLEQGALPLKTTFIRYACPVILLVDLIVQLQLTKEKTPE